MWLIVDLLKSITNFPFSLTFDNFVYYVIPLLIVYYCFKQFKLYHKRKNCDLSGKTVLVSFIFKINKLYVFLIQQ